MVIKSSFFNICLIILLTLSCQVRADEALTAVNFKGVYEFGFEGLMFGRAGFEIEQDAKHYNAAADIMSGGIAKLFIHHSSHTTTVATGSNYNYPSIVYESNYHTNKKQRYVKLTYKGGELAEEKIVPPENPERRPPVPQAQKKDAADLLTFILRMRLGLIDAMKQNKQTYNVKAYDGRRLMEIDFTVLGRKHLRGSDDKTAIAVAVRRKLLAGYTPSELADYDPKEPTLTIYFTDDAKLIPVRFEVPMMIGMLSANLVKECGAGESCLLGVTN